MLQEQMHCNAYSQFGKQTSHDDLAEIRYLRLQWVLA